MKLWYEDIEVGTVHELGSYTFEQDEMIRYAEKYDRQAMHLDPEAAKEWVFGGLIASGWMTAAVFMKLFVAHKMKMARAEKDDSVQFAPSPGFENLRWVRPVYAGDTITYRSTVTGKRVLKSRPGLGLVFYDNEGVNQNGDLVYGFLGKGLFERRES